MLQTPRLISKLIFLSFIFLLGCGTPATKSEESDTKKTNVSKVFAFPYESVWRAAQLTLKYPIAVNNMDNGVLETEWIRGVDGYIPPVEGRAPSAGIKYKISLNMVKGKLDGKSSVRVTVAKKLERQKDFFADVENLQSDGYEEKVIFYRIERELLIEEALKKAAASGNQ